MSDKNIESNAPPDAQEVFSLLSDLSGALLKWSEEGISGMEEMIVGVGEEYGYKDITVLFSPQSVLLSMSHRVTLLRTELPGLPELSKVTALRHWHNDILAGKLSVEAAPDSALRQWDASRKEKEEAQESTANPALLEK